MINISRTKPNELILNSFKSQFPNATIYSLEILHNYFVVRTVFNNELETVLRELNIVTVDELSKSNEMKLKILEIGVLYPLNFVDKLKDIENIPMGLIDNLYQQIIEVSGLGAPIDFDVVSYPIAMPNKDIIEEMKKKYDKATILGMETLSGYFIFKNITYSEFKDIKTQVQAFSIDGNPSDDMVEAYSDELIIKHALIYPEVKEDQSIGDVLPAGVAVNILSYIMKISGWGDYEVEVIE